MIKDVLDTHTHTLASGHAYNTIDEMFNNNVDISPLVPLCELEMYIQKQKK